MAFLHTAYSRDAPLYRYYMGEIAISTKKIIHFKFKNSIFPHEPPLIKVPSCFYFTILPFSTTELTKHCLFYLETSILTVMGCLGDN